MTLDPASAGGMVFDNRRIGSLAGRRLVGMIHHWEKGSPAARENLEVEGSFEPGATVADRVGAAQRSARA
jgi:hypothetical protein